MIDEGTLTAVFKQFGDRTQISRPTEEALLERVADDVEAGAVVAVLERRTPVDPTPRASLLVAAPTGIRLFSTTDDPDDKSIVETLRGSLPPDFTITRKWMIDERTGRFVAITSLRLSEPLNGDVAPIGYKPEHFEELEKVLTELRRKA